MVRAQRILGIQYLRCISALMVLSFHLCVLYHWDFHTGQVGVDILFVISGFVMWSSTWKHDTSSLRFIIRRVWRLVPLYWIVTWSTVAVGYASHLFDGTRMGAEEILKSLFCISYRHSRLPEWPIVMQGWTMNVEMFFYLVFALAVSQRPRLRLWVPTVILVSLVVTGRLFHPVSAVGVQVTSGMLLELVAGLWVGFAYTSGWLRHPRAGLALIAGGAIALVVCQLIGVQPDSLRVVRWGIPAVALVAGCLMVEKGRGMPKVSLFLLLGDASYSIYLWHLLGITILSAAAMRLGLGDGIMAAFLVGGLSLLASVLGYLLIERPLLDSRLAAAIQNMRIGGKESLAVIGESDA